jgi:enoyl-CoA hydratase
MTYDTLTYPREGLEPRVRCGPRQRAAPKNQLMMQKLIVNQAFDDMGLASAQMIATLFDGIGRGDAGK